VGEKVEDTRNKEEEESDLSPATWLPEDTSKEVQELFFKTSDRQLHHEEINQRLQQLNPCLDVHLYDSKVECLANWQDHIFSNRPPSPPTESRMNQDLSTLYDRAKSAQVGVNSIHVRYNLEASQGKEYYVT
jgi:hypothetical protein